ncbi:ABC transporter permease [Candidatus Poriferisocius sp.]|uniref:ABC transporter permease n=1 Tax=Candidatus Poriferisocius sp. TaxID=3101276 RepID=UPI003B59872A
MARADVIPSPRLAYEYWLVTYRRNWKGSLFTIFLSPILFLAAMGLGLGSLVDAEAGARQGLGGLDYLDFLAPGLLAGNAMMLAVNESTYPVMGGFKWYRTYLAMAASPLRDRDILLGHFWFMASRVALASVVFLGVMAVFGAVSSPLALLAPLAATLCGMAFATPTTAFVATRTQADNFSTFTRFVIMPMFLFSGIFYPVSQLPVVLEQIAWITPVWHGVRLCRALSTGGGLGWDLAGHAVYLVALILLGWRAAAHTFARKLYE